MRKLFTAHPNSIGESYREHALFAFKMGLRLCLAGFACIIHAIFSFFIYRNSIICRDSF